LRAINQKRRFALVAPNYHPLTCGVGDHSMRLGGELLRRGFSATVFTHAPAETNPNEPALPVSGVPGRDPVTIAAAIAAQILKGGFSDVVLQYVARIWGGSRFGSPALPLLAARLAEAGVAVTLIAHELFTPWQLRPDLAMGAGLTRLQLAMTMGSCSHVFVTTGSRQRLIGPAVAALAPARGLHIMRIGPNALPVPWTSRPSGRRLGLFSTMAVGKRFDVVIEAFEAVTRVHPDAELLLIGDLGPPTGRAGQMLSARLEGSAGRDRIRMTGKLSLGEIANAVASLDVYLFPMDTGANTRSGTLPLALGSGVPVVAVAGVETDPLFVDGENIVFARSLTGAAFADATLDLLADPSRRARVGEEGRRLYERELAWGPIMDGFLNVVR
jgi:glycosyltransferase involved in cell wall biosynthesis